MKTLFKILQVLGLVFVTNVQAQDVTIPDPGLREAIFLALTNTLSGPITENDLSSLTNLDASFQNVATLQGLEGCYNLLSLTLYGNQLTNISSLGALTNLTSLDVGGNGLTSFSLPPALTRLTTLRLSANYLSDYTWLTDVTNLTDLEIQYE